MSTINHVRLARANPAIVRACEDCHPGKAEDDDERHAYGAPIVPKVDPYTRRANICPTCHIARATGTGECLC